MQHSEKSEKKTACSERMPSEIKRKKERDDDDGDDDGGQYRTYQKVSPHWSVIVIL